MKMEDIKSQKVSWLRESFDKNVSPLIVDDNTTLTEAAKKLLANKYNILAVVGEGKVVGIVSRTDIARSMMKLDKVSLKPESNILAVANENFFKVLEEDNIEHVIDTLVEKKLDNVIVCDNNDRLVGIVNRRKLAYELEKLAS